MWEVPADFFCVDVLTRMSVHYLLGPYLAAGRCRGDTRVFPGRHRVITGRLSKEEVGSLDVVTPDSSFANFRDGCVLWCGYAWLPPFLNQAALDGGDPAIAGYLSWSLRRAIVHAAVQRPPVQSARSKKPPDPRTQGLLLSS